MPTVNDSIRAKFFKRCYESIDGLWFMKIEEEDGFERALEIDRRVWEIVPKIQARTLRGLLGIEEAGIAALSKALKAKAELDEAEAEIVIENDKSLRLIFRRCPWFELMKKSNREHLAGKVGKTICGTEYPVWQREFKAGNSFELKSMLCDGGDCCVMEFRDE